VERSPAGQLLILSANLKKGLPRDRIDSEIANFTRRVPRILPFAPDAVLLQEVVESTAARVAELLKEPTGFGFDVAVTPGPEPVVGKQDGQIVVRTTAILINRRSMRLIDGGGFVRSRYLSRDASPEFEPRIKEHAHCLARTASGRIDLPLASIHFVTNEKFAAPTMGFCYKAQWARRLADFLATQYPQAGVLQVPVIGGDFNNRRCMAPREKVACDVMPFWHVLSAQNGYSDAVYARHGKSEESLADQLNGRKRIDYVFTRGAIVDASHDADYDAQKGDPGFYSDHRFLWALVRPRGGIS
jgi:hypothetical protein